MEDISKNSNDFFDIVGSISVPPHTNIDAFTDDLTEWAESKGYGLYTMIKPNVDPKHPLEIGNNPEHCKELWESAFFSLLNDTQLDVIQKEHDVTIQCGMWRLNIYDTGSVIGYYKGDPCLINIFKIVNKLNYLGYDMPIPNLNLSEGDEEE